LTKQGGLNEFYLHQGKEGGHRPLQEGRGGLSCGLQRWHHCAASEKHPHDQRHGAFRLDDKDEGCRREPRAKGQHDHYRYETQEPNGTIAL